MGLQRMLRVCIVAVVLGIAGTGQPARAEEAAGNGYVGAAGCRSCHEAIYQGWKSTLHPYKFQDATPKAVVGDFTENNTLRADGYTTRMSKKGDAFFVTTLGPDNREHTYRVKYLIGEFWKQLYVTEFPNGELHILPAMWLVETGKWVKTKNWSKTIYQYGCSGCHNTGTRINYDKDTDTFSTVWADKGVACEACHGPGGKHVRAARGDGDVTATIVNPARIPDPRLAAMVCGSCHNRGTSKDGRFGYPAGYLPGDQLDHLFIEKPKLDEAHYSSANRQQYIDWKQSGHARAGVVCWDCHFVHRKGKANRYQTKLPGNALCRSCHAVESRGVHGLHSVNNCIGCHMPAIGKRAVKGDVHSHRFQVISPAVSIRAGGTDRQQNSCTLCHYHRDSDPHDLLKRLEKARL